MNASPHPGPLRLLRQSSAGCGGRARGERENNLTPVVEYDRVGAVSAAELGDLVALVKELRGEALTWLRERHPELV